MSLFVETLLLCCYLIPSILPCYTTATLLSCDLTTLMLRYIIWKYQNVQHRIGGCSSAGRAGQLVMAASAISEGPGMSWWLVQGGPCPRPETAAIVSSNKPRYPIKRIKRLRTTTWHDNTPGFIFIQETQDKHIKSDSKNSKKKKNPLFI